MKNSIYSDILGIPPKTEKSLFSIFSQLKIEIDDTQEGSKVRWLQSESYGEPDSGADPPDNTAPDRLQG